MNRGPTLLHYDFKVVTYSNSTRSQHPFTIRTYLKNGKRWAKFPFLAAQSRLIVVGKLCGFTTSTTGDRLLAVLADNCNFLSSHDSLQQPLPQTPQSTKHSLRDLWDRSDIDDGDIGPSTPSKVRHVLASNEIFSPLGTSNQAERYLLRKPRRVMRIFRFHKESVPNTIGRLAREPDFASFGSPY